MTFVCRFERRIGILACSLPSSFNLKTNMKTKKLYLLSVVALGLLWGTPSHAQGTLVDSLNAAKKTGSRDITIEKVDNDRADFAVLVEVDREDATYREGDLIHARVKSSRDGFLYLVHISSTGKETLLIPNEYQLDNEIKANKAVDFPAKDANFLYRISGPNFGRETIKAIVTDRKLKSVDARKFTQAPVTVLEAKDSKSIVDELEKSKDIVIESRLGASGDTKFATHQVSYTTRSKNAATLPSAKPKRFAVCIGVEKFKDPRIRPLSVCVNDANAYAKLLTTYGGVDKDNCVVLTNEEVTLEIIKKIFCDILPEKAPPGSEILIFWSGHGGRMSATRAESSSTGYVEYLVPYDGRLSDPENTMLLEGPFGQWVQRLNGRKLFFVLDACHSGGMTARAKSMNNADEEKPAETLAEAIGRAKSVADDPEEEFIDFSFGFQSFARSKALGQNGLAVLASSSYNQLSWERDEGDLSVLTYFLIKTIIEGPRSITHKDLKPKVREAVDRYIGKTYPNTRQTIVEQDDLTPGLLLKP